MALTSRIVLIAPLLALGFASTAPAQVHRCGDSRLYTDKPCDGATRIDLRSNILNAGPRGMPAEAAPAPAVIPPDRTPVPQAGDSSGSVWDRRDSQDAEFRARTTGSRP